MSNALDKRLSALERPCGNGFKQLPECIVRPDGQTEIERMRFDADVQRRNLRGESLIVIAPGEDPFAVIAGMCV